MDRRGRSLTGDLFFCQLVSLRRRKKTYFKPRDVTTFTGMRGGAYIGTTENLVSSRKVYGVFKPWVP